MLSLVVLYRTDDLVTTSVLSFVFHSLLLFLNHVHITPAVYALCRILKRLLFARTVICSESLGPGISERFPSALQCVS